MKTRTIQQTSKMLKAYYAGSLAALFISIFVLFCAIGMSNDTGFIIGLILISIINIITSKFLIWWHHE